MEDNKPKETLSEWTEWQVLDEPLTMNEAIRINRKLDPQWFEVTTKTLSNDLGIELCKLLGLDPDKTVSVTIEATVNGLILTVKQILSTSSNLAKTE